MLEAAQGQVLVKGVVPFLARNRSLYLVRK
jgi:hypothetical protein